MTAKRTAYPTRRYSLITDDDELGRWRAAAAAAGIRDLSTWLRVLASRELDRVRRLGAAAYALPQKGPRLTLLAMSLLSVLSGCGRVGLDDVAVAAVPDAPVAVVDGVDGGTCTDATAGTLTCFRYDDGGGTCLDLGPLVCRRYDDGGTCLELVRLWSCPPAPPAN
jgi:hypothetical protein